MFKLSEKLGQILKGKNGLPALGGEYDGTSFVPFPHKSHEQRLGSSLLSPLLGIISQPRLKNILAICCFDA